MNGLFGNRLPKDELAQRNPNTASAPTNGSQSDQSHLDNGSCHLEEAFKSKSSYTSPFMPPPCPAWYDGISVDMSIGVSIGGTIGMLVAWLIPSPIGKTVVIFVGMVVGTMIGAAIGMIGCLQMQSAHENLPARFPSSGNENH